MATSHSHGTAAQVEPVTPLWLTFTGVALFVLLGAGYMYRSSTDPVQPADGAQAAPAAAPVPVQGAAPAGAPGGAKPRVGPNGAPIKNADDLLKMMKAPAGHP